MGLSETVVCPLSSPYFLGFRSYKMLEYEPRAETTMNSSEANALLSNHRPGYTLPRPFYEDAGIFDAEFEAVLAPLWIVAGHTSQLAAPGAYIEFGVGGDSVLVIRGRDERIRAFFNTCRHRGSQLCAEKSGVLGLIRCPYHAWTYDLDGRLRPPPYMPDDFDAAQHNLHECDLSIEAGLIFVRLANNGGADFAVTVEPARDYLQALGFARAKVASKRTYPVKANWKLAIENLMECYHCLPSHPEFCTVHSTDEILATGAGPDGAASAAALAAFTPALEAFAERSRQRGIPVGTHAAMLPEQGFCMAERAPLAEGMSTGGPEGKPVAPLMGIFEEYDGGETRMFFGPLTIVEAYNDYAAMLVYVPKRVDYTEVEVTWFVDEAAQAGKDYRKEDVEWLWDRTTQQDGALAELQALGVRSSRFTPGRFGNMEAGASQFVDWYVQRMQAAM